jgi:hypothetical protein
LSIFWLEIFAGSIGSSAGSESVQI